MMAEGGIDFRQAVATGLKMIEEINCDDVRRMMTSSLKSADAVLEKACGNGTCNFEQVNVSHSLMEIVINVSETASVADQKMCLGQIVSDPDVFVSMFELKDKFQNAMIQGAGSDSAIQRMQRAFDYLASWDDDLAEHLGGGILDRRLSVPLVGKETQHCPKPCKRCKSTRIGYFECILPYEQRRSTPSEFSDKISCGKPRWRLLKFRHSVYCEVPEAIVIEFQQSHITALVTCIAGSALGVLKMGSPMPNVTFTECLGLEQRFIHLPTVESTKFVDMTYSSYTSMRDKVVSDDSLKAFAIFVTTGLASALGGVRLGAQTNTLPPDVNMMEVWRSFDYSVVPPELIPLIKCEPPLSETNVFVGALKIVLSAAVAVGGAVFLGIPLSMIVLLMYALLGIVRMGGTYGQLFDGTVMFALTMPYTFLTGIFSWMMGTVGDECGRVVVIGQGNETPQCVKPLKYGYSALQRCPGGEMGQAECRLSDSHGPQTGKYETQIHGCT